ncbi:unnamed protein product [Menidia menidia]|uniref:(Atlantic silverside) hypothetical protein n=1 Tax=Menidia menidia TaxID=238744 RepID=A0A8S4AGM1_9TELE|nr:unnamed protein product [Menidia menidia]
MRGAIVGKVLLSRPVNGGGSRVWGSASLWGTAGLSCQGGKQSRKIWIWTLNLDPEKILVDVCEQACKWWRFQSLGQCQPLGDGRFELPGRETKPEHQDLDSNVLLSIRIWTLMAPHLALVRVSQMLGLFEPEHLLKTGNQQRREEAGWWVLFQRSNFSRYQYLLGPGEYQDYGLWMGFQDCVRSCRILTCTRIVHAASVTWDPFPDRNQSPDPDRNQTVPLFLFLLEL